MKSGFKEIVTSALFLHTRSKLLNIIKYYICKFVKNFKFEMSY